MCVVFLCVNNIEKRTAPVLYPVCVLHAGSVVIQLSFLPLWLLTSPASVHSVNLVIGSLLGRASRKWVPLLDRSHLQIGTNISTDHFKVTVYSHWVTRTSQLRREWVEGRWPRPGTPRHCLDRLFDNTSTHVRHLACAQYSRKESLARVVVFGTVLYRLYIQQRLYLRTVCTAVGGCVHLPWITGGKAWDIISLHFICFMRVSKLVLFWIPGCMFNIWLWDSRYKSPRCTAAVVFHCTCSFKGNYKLCMVIS